MKVLHLASFSGNIGDGANHRGFYKNFTSLIDASARFTECEIRQFYRSWGIRHFDESFVSQVNQHDLLVIGGGNFFEICWDYSKTGTTIDISAELLRKIRTPILINGIGFDTTKGFSEKSRRAFWNFLSLLIDLPNVYLTFRNDGSTRLLQECYGTKVVDELITVPDGGFFFEIESDDDSVQEQRRRLGVCVARDMSERRFAKTGFAGFAATFASWLEGFCAAYPGYDICFVPHIFSDISAIYDVVELLPDPIRRQRISIAPLSTENPWSIDHAFKAYAQCDLVLSTRFHGNVVAIGNGIPTIGLTTGRKYGLLYEEIEASDRHIAVSEDDLFWDELTSLTASSLGEQEEIKARYAQINRKLHREVERIYEDIGVWLRSQRSK